VLKPINIGFEGGINFPIKNVEVKTSIKHSIGNMFVIIDIPPTGTPKNKVSLFMLMTGVKMPLP
jgi:hypothetical protein